MTMMTKGFTLIELLIVVLIIAILAAIAVPNFLEFQTRAKVSRVKSDQRSLAAAVEAYTVDNNRPPIDGNYGANTLGRWPSTARDGAWGQVTTPIAYITSIPQDPFLERIKHTNEVNQPLDENAFNFHCYLDNQTAVRLNAYREGYYWSCYSIGPNLTKGSPWLPQMVQNNNADNIYDPTNGTVSPGYVTRSNKGEFTGAEVR